MLFYFIALALAHTDGEYFIDRLQTMPTRQIVITRA